MGKPPDSSGIPAQLFDTAEACCKEKLFWLDVDQCITDTNGHSL